MKTFDFIDTPSWNRGQNVETSFQDILDRRGIEYRRSTLEEQYKHFDYVTDRGTIDVKARKRKLMGFGHRVYKNFGEI